MAERGLKVSIIGDASSLSRAFKTAGVEAETFGSRLTHVAKIATLLVGGAAIGGLAIALDKSVKAAMAGQASQAALSTALKATHQSAEAVTPALEAAESSARKLGFSTEDSRTALSRLEVATGSTTKSVTDLGVAEDIARFKHTGLTNATQMLAMAMTGSQRAAKQLGISVPPVTSNFDALKASGEKLTDQTGKLDAANAKYLDKLATGQAVIDAVTQKVHGQADAFSQTAEGGMQTFQAQLGFIEESLGNRLLPALVSVLNWVNDHWPQIGAVVASVADTISGVIDGVLRPAFQDAIDIGKTLFGFYEDNKTTVQVLAGALAGLVLGIEAVIVATKAYTIVQAALDIALDANPIGVVVVGLAALAGAMVVAYEKSTTFRNIVDGAFASVKAAVEGVRQAFEDHRELVERVMGAAGAAISQFRSILEAQFNLVRSALRLVIDLIHGDFGKAWGDAQTIVKSAVTIMGGAALAAGRAILQGIWDGVRQLPGLVAGAFQLLEGVITGFVSSAYQWALDIGKHLVSGVVDGLEGLASEVGSKMTSGLSSAYHSVTSVFKIGSPSRLMADGVGRPLADGVSVGWVEGMAPLSSTMTSTLRDAIEKARQVVSNSRSVFQSAFGDLASMADSAFSGITGAVKTPAEKALAALDLQSQNEQLKKGLTDAQAVLATAYLNSLGANSLEVQAAQQGVQDAETAVLRNGLEIRAAEERKQQDAIDALRLSHLNASLTALETGLTKEGATWKTAHAAILKLLASYGIDYANAGAAMGAAFIQGLQEVIDAAAAKSAALKGAISSTAAGVSNISNSLTARLPQFATGGPTGNYGGLAVLHPNEFVVPAGGALVSGGGSSENHFHFSFPNYIGSRRELAQALRTDPELVASVGLAAGKYAKRTP